MVPYQNSTTWCLNVVMSVKIYVNHNVVYIPEFCYCIMNSNTKSDLCLEELMHVGCSMFWSRVRYCGLAVLLLQL